MKKQNSNGASVIEIPLDLEEVQPIQYQAPEHLEKNYILQLQQFQKRLDDPPSTTILKHPFTKKDYLPIDYIQNKLDELYLGQWDTCNLSHTVVENEILISLVLVVVHPISQREIRRTGTAAIQIKAVSGEDGAGNRINPVDIKNKQTATLVKDFPACESMAIKNAASKLGNVFGRNLNRKDETIYQMSHAGMDKIKMDIAQMKELIEACQGIDELNTLMLENQSFLVNNNSLLKTFNLKRKAFAPKNGIKKVQANGKS